SHAAECSASRARPGSGSEAARANENRAQTPRPGALARRDTPPFLLTPQPPRTSLPQAHTETSARFSIVDLTDRHEDLGDADADADDLSIDVDFHDFDEIDAPPRIEVVGEEEIDTRGIAPRSNEDLGDEDFDFYGNLRDTLIDPIDTRFLFSS